MEDRLYEIIAASFSQEPLNQEENLILQEWLKTSAEHRILYGKLQKFYERGEVFRKQGGINHSEAWRRIVKASGISSVRPRKISLRKTVGVAAGFLLLIGLGVLLWWKFDDSVASVEYTKAFLPGATSVQLKLENGKKVELTPATTSVVVSDEGKRVSCISNVLDYYTDSLVSRESKIVYNTLIVPVGAEYKLILSDGTRVYMNAASEIRYPTVFSGDSREVYLKGEAYFEVEKDSRRRFMVKTGQMDIVVLGTAFNVNAYPDMDVCVATLASGRIRATCNGTDYDLSPGNQIRQDRLTGEVKIQEVDTELYTCWKDGYYYFEACRLEDIMQTLSRWYGIQVFFQNSDLKSVEFTGHLKRYEDVDHLFRKFEQTRNICFKRKGNSVIVSVK